MSTRGGETEWSALDSSISPSLLRSDSGGLLGRLPRKFKPLFAPLARHLLRQHPGGSVVLDPLADALRAELGEQLLEALTAEVDGLGVGPVAQPEHAVAQLRQVRAPG